MNYSNYDVAVMNYPLFNKKEENKVEDKFFACTDKESSPIYIHIPFCDNLCDFCIYNRVLAYSGSPTIEHYVDALIKEIQLYGERMRHAKIGSVFIGGGTPTVLTESQLYRVISALQNHFDIDGCELTVECNPASADRSKLEMLRKLNVTRVSTGVQTFDNSLRAKLHIQNTSQDMINWLELAKEIGFADISLDLIYGFPETDTSHFLKDLDTALQLNLGHISIYKLTVFAYTKLYREISRPDTNPLPLEEKLYEMFLESHYTLRSNGYILQSVQEYGKETNSVKFWELTYDGYGNNLSFGASGYGYLNGYCYQNESKVTDYVGKINSNLAPIGRISPEITEEQRMERAVIMGFRRGYVSKEKFYQNFNRTISDVFLSQLNRQMVEGYLLEDDKGYYLTPSGIYHQGRVSADYMISIFRGVTPLKKKYCIGLHEMP